MRCEDPKQHQPRETNLSENFKANAYLNESRAVVDKMTRMANMFAAHKGRIEFCDLWGELDDEFTHPSMAKENLRHMEQFFRVLRSLTATYEAHICRFRTQFGVPRLTPASLPDEIILLILEHAGYDLRSLIKYSHVCSRIRNVILNSPSAWARCTLGIKLPVPLIDLIAHRCGDCGIAAMLFLDRDPSFWSQDALLRVFEFFKHRSRWTNVSLLICEHAAKEVLRRFPGGELTLLHTFSVGSYFMNPPRTFFYQGWSFPVLTNCTLYLQGLDQPEIIVFLSSAPNLTYLKLSETDMTDMVPGGPHHNEVTLPRLAHLELRTKKESETGVWGDLPGAIHCPHLKCLTLSLPGFSWNFDAVMNGIRSRYPSLIRFRLSLNLSSNEHPSVNIFFQDVLFSLPVTIEKIRFNICYDVRFHTLRTSDIAHHTAESKYPNLKELDLELDSNPDNNFIVNLSALLERLSVKLLKLGYDSYAEATLRRAGVLVDSPTGDASTGLTELLCGC